MSDRRPNNRGVMVGRVVKLLKGENKAAIKLEKKLSLGDGLEFWVKVGGRVGTTVNKMTAEWAGGNKRPARYAGSYRHTKRRTHE